ncbi:MAG: hypothetical protein QM820_27660 [Minicystis sp.]
MSQHGQLQRDAVSGSRQGIDPSASKQAREPRRGATAEASQGPSRRARAALPMETAGAGMLVRAVSVRAPEVVFVKGLVEASDGLASVFAERGGELLLATPHGRDAELSELLADLEAEIGARVGDAPGGMGWDTDRQER